MNADIKEAVIKAFEKSSRRIEEFYENKRYLDLIDIIVSQDMDNYDYSEDKKWTEDVDQMFDFLYEVAGYIKPFDSNVVIEHNGKFIELFESHGQGCYRSIKTLESANEYVSFEDIVSYEVDKIKPLRTEVLEITNVALSSLEEISNSLNLGINIDMVREYLRLNLK